MKLTKREKKDIHVLIRFVGIFCQQNHSDRRRERFSPPFDEVAPLLNKNVILCRSCSDLLAYGIRKRFRCPHDPKPMCKKCETQCYSRAYKEGIRQVMKFSGPYLIKRGRLDLLYHYLA